MFYIIQKYQKFRAAFQELGQHWVPTEELMDLLEEFTCHLYGSKSKDVNKLRYKLFNRKYVKEDKIIDLSLRPPCRSVLQLHIRRANFVAAIWRRSVEAMVAVPPITLHGWLHNGYVEWIKDIFPTEIEDILLTDDFDENDFELGGECESETEDSFN